jgi:prepilin-type N-terminal cleavage/methylation domain-containing protein
MVVTKTGIAKSEEVQNMQNLNLCLEFGYRSYTSDAGFFAENSRWLREFLNSRETNKKFGKKEKIMKELPRYEKKKTERQQAGFTLVELLVVIAIIGLLMGVLMPSLNKARQMSYCAKAGGNLHNVGVAMETFVADLGFYPPSYLYPDTATDEDVMSIIGHQPVDHPYGYLHWSWFLFESGRCDASAFTCPAVKNGGAPRTNPGKKAKDWESGQVDELGNTGPNPLQDKQAPRMAFTGNAAVIPRNKFKDAYSEYPRNNRLVKPTEVARPGEVIMLTEFNENWQAVGVGGSGGTLAKSHRPILPFEHVGTGYQGYAVYEAEKDQCCYEYGAGATATDYGLKPLKDIENPANKYIDGDTGHQLNAVGRHHPGTWTNSNGDNMGGTTLFLYCDGHTERKTLIETLKNLEWGKEFYSITGDKTVRY